MGERSDVSSPVAVMNRAVSGGGIPTIDVSFGKPGIPHAFGVFTGSPPARSVEGGRGFSIERKLRGSAGDAGAVLFPGGQFGQSFMAGHV